MGLLLRVWLWVSILTDSKQLNTSISQALCRWNDVILGFPIRDEDPNLGYTNPRARFRPETVLQDISQRKAWRDKERETKGGKRKEDIIRGRRVDKKDKEKETSI